MKAIIDLSVIENKLNEIQKEIIDLKLILFKKDPQAPLASDAPKKLLDGDGYLRVSQILEILPIGKSSWWAGVKDGKFPAPVKLGSRTTVWTKQSIREIMYQFSVS